MRQPSSASPHGAWSSGSPVKVMEYDCRPSWALSNPLFLPSHLFAATHHRVLQYTVACYSALVSRKECSLQPTCVEPAQRGADAVEHLVKARLDCPLQENIDVRPRQIYAAHTCACSDESCVVCMHCLRATTSRACMALET